MTLYVKRREDRNRVEGKLMMWKIIRSSVLRCKDLGSIYCLNF